MVQDGPGWTQRNPLANGDNGGVVVDEEPRGARGFAHRIEKQQGGEF